MFATSIFKYLRNTSILFQRLNKTSKYNTGSFISQEISGNKFYKDGGYKEVRLVILNFELTKKHYICSNVGTKVYKNWDIKKQL